MTPKQQETYDAYIDLFSTKGWKIFMETVGEYKKNFMTEGMYAARTELDLGVLQGKIAFIDMILSLENTLTSNNEAEAQDNADDL